MEDRITHRIVSSLSLRRLEAEVRRLVRVGWRKVGEPAMAMPDDPTKPPYWAQTLVRKEGTSSPRQPRKRAKRRSKYD